MVAKLFILRALGTLTTLQHFPTTHSTHSTHSIHFTKHLTLRPYRRCYHLPHRIHRQWVRLDCCPVRQIQHAVFAEFDRVGFDRRLFHLHPRRCLVLLQIRWVVFPLPTMHDGSARFVQIWSAEWRSAVECTVYSNLGLE